MKRTNAPPQGAPPGTLWFGGPIQEYKVILRVNEDGPPSETVVTSQDCDGDPEDAILSILENLPAAASHAQVDVLCQVFLDTSNRGFTLPASLIQRLADQNIELRIEVYDLSDPKRA
jgi:hypothetical protein